MVRLFNLLTGQGLILAIIMLGVMALPYSPAMRSVLGALPVFSGFIKASDAKRFLMLKKVYNSSYQLIVLIIRQSIQLLIRWVALGVFVLLAYNAAHIFDADRMEQTRVIALVAVLAMVCPVLGIIQWILWTRKLLYDLREYEVAVRKVLPDARHESRQ